MRKEQEHEIIPAIRDWLAATADVDVSPGLSREESRRRARELLAELASGTIVRYSDFDDDLRDVVWAAIDELNQLPPGQTTFQQCDRLYQLVSSLVGNCDPFGELDEILSQTAKIGWNSAPGGCEAVLQKRADIWRHGDEDRHREACEKSDELPVQIRALKDRKTLEVAQILGICARVAKLGNVQPSLEVLACAALREILNSPAHRIGFLDDCEFLRGATSLANAMGCRQLGRWEEADSGYLAAEAAFRRTIGLSDLDRVRMERLALHYARGRFQEIINAAPSLTVGVTLARERIKGNLILASTLVNLGRPREGLEILLTIINDPAVGEDAALHACVLLKLGNAFSDMGDSESALASFRCCSALLSRYHHPILLAGLVGTVGEHLAIGGHFEEAAALHAAARDAYVEVGQRPQAGYQSILLAEMLIMLGRTEDAEHQLLAVFPLIKKLDLRREGLAAIALLRESMDRGAEVNAMSPAREQMKGGPR